MPGVGGIGYRPGEPHSHQFGINEDLAGVHITQLAAVAVGIGDVPFQADSLSGGESAGGTRTSLPQASGSGYNSGASMLPNLTW